MTNRKPEWHEPVEMIQGGMDDPMEDTIEVGAVTLVDGPIDPVPLNAGSRRAEGDNSGTSNGMGERVKDVTQKAQDVAQGVAGKAQDAAHTVADKAQDVAQNMAGKAQDVTQKLADSAASAKTAASGALDTAKSAVGNAGTATKTIITGTASKIGTASATGAQSAGMALWDIVQRNPLQALLVFASLIWLIRNNKATISQPPVSLTDVAGDAAEKVGSVAGQVQVAASNLGSQVQEQAQRGAGWFSQTLHDNPLAIGAMAIVFGSALGFAVPETPYEHQLMGETRDKLADKAQAAAQDLTQKVQTVAQTAAHEAVESVKEEAKNQGLTG